MKVYKTQEEVQKDIKDGVLAIDDDVTFECSISISASITAQNITAWDITAQNITAQNITARDINAQNITAWDINAWNINAGNINAWDINAWDINAWNINAGDITAQDINAGDITAQNINAWNINAGDITAQNINAWDINAVDITARDILYYAFCCVYQSINCTSIKARRTPHQEPICLEGKLTIKDKQDTATTEAIELLKKKGYKIVKE